MGIRILPPDINEGEGHFTVCGENAVRFGMVGVRNVGTKAVEAIVRARAEGGKFQSLHDFCERVESAAVSRQAAESLVKAGAFDCLPGNRAQKVAALEDALRMGARTQLAKRRGQKSLFGGGGAEAKPPDHALPAVKEWPLAELGRHEKEVLGFRLSFNPLERHEAVISQLTTDTAQTLKDKADRSPAIVAGEIVAMRPMLTKHGRGMAQIELEDLTGTLRAVAFPEAFERYGALLKEDSIVFLIGAVDRSGQRPGILVQEVIPVAEAQAKLTAAVKLCLQRTGMDKQVIENLRAICERHPGDRPVLIEIAMPDQQRMLIRAGRELFVRPSEEFTSEVEQLLGEGHLRLTPRMPNGNGSSNGRPRYNASSRGTSPAAATS
jgi:DNA polymerase-3 subunit alpha